jgi:hypothetical protein
MVFSRIALALGLGLVGVTAAQASIVSFTNSTLAGASSVLDDSTPGYAGSNLCAGHGTCATKLTYNTGVGKLTVTAEDGADFDKLALVNHSNYNNAGLGVVTGFQKHNKFVIADGNYSLSSKKETLTLSFDNQVSLSQLFFFPDDRKNYALTHELDKWDGFTLSVDGGKFVEYSFGTQGGQPVTFGSALVGKTFTFGYAKKLSGEDYYLAGLNVTKVTSPVPEASSMALLFAGLAAVGGIASRRRQQA